MASTFLPARRRVSFNDEPLRVGLPSETSKFCDDTLNLDDEPQMVPLPSFEFLRDKSADQSHCSGSLPKYLSDEILSHAPAASDHDQGHAPAAFSDYLMDKNRRLEEENALLRMQMASQMAGLHVASQGLRAAQGLPIAMPPHCNLGADRAWLPAQWASNEEQHIWPHMCSPQRTSPLYSQPQRFEKHVPQQQEEDEADDDAATDPGQGFDMPEVQSVHAWLPENDPDARSTASSDPEVAKAVPQTSIMLRNLPNCYTRDMLLKLMNAEGFAGKYDFVYLPMDFKTKLSLAYAFINFVSNDEAVRFRKHFNLFSKWVIPSRKVARVNWSEFQGLANHIERFRNNSVMHKHVPDQYKPVLLSGGERVPFPLPLEKVRTDVGGRSAAHPSKKGGQANSRSQARKVGPRQVPPGPRM